MTNRILLALNALLLVAVAFLFYKVFSSPATSEPAEAPVAAKEAKVNPADTAKAPILAAGSGEGIYYVNTDTLLARYKVFKTQKAALESKSKRIEGEISRRAQSLQADQQREMQKLQAGQMNEAQAQEADARLRQRAAELERYRDEQTNALVDEERKQSEKLNKTIQDFLKGFAGRRGYKYVLGYTTGGGILFANDSLDITDAVVAGLNSK